MITYKTNNSGGGWWLTDDDWRAMEADGWVVDWRDRPFLGTKATDAHLPGATMDEALESFRRATGQDPEEEGCPCCGEPHLFFEETDVIPGQLATEEAIAA